MTSQPQADSVTRLVREPGERIFFIDLFRFIGVFLMVQGHVFRALVSWDLTHTFFWQVHEVMHKLTAPIFLFGAGMIFMIVTRNRWDSYRRFNSVTWRRLRRYLYFLLIGYWLHLPYISLSKTMSIMNAELLAKMTVVDVLHIISIGLILLQLLSMLLKDPRRAVWVLLPLSVISIAIAFLLASRTIAGPAPLVSWITTQNGSWFTIFPSWGYLFLGAALGSLFPQTGLLSEEFRFIKILLMSGAGMLLLGVVLVLILGVDFVYRKPFEPEQTICILGGVFLLLCLSWFLEKKGIARRLKGVFFLSEESLIVYVVHLIVTYGSVLSPGLGDIIGNSLGIGWLLVALLGVSAVTFSFAWVWYRFKKRRLDTLRVLQFAMVIIFLLVFVIYKQ